MQGGAEVTPVIIESPYAANPHNSVETHLRYLDECIRWCIANGYTPYASHKMLTTALNDNDLEQRSQGNAAGIAMAKHVKLVFFFLDFGMSGGMKQALEVYQLYDEIEVRMMLLPYGTLKALLPEAEAARKRTVQ